MTVGYNLIVSTSGPWSLVKLLLKWRGSIWKAVWAELSVWLVLFFVISSVYRYALTSEQQTNFDKLSKYVETKMEYIPLNFMLGFFVTEVVRRWGIIFTNIGILDNVSLMASAHIEGSSEEARMMRRSIVRYCALSQCLVFRDISMQVRKRFPTLDTVVLGRFMLPHEKERFESVQNGFAKYWMPFHWAMCIANDARRKGYCDSDIRVTALIDEIKNFRTQMATLCNYDWVPLPIMYPQLVFLAVHVYFALCLVCRQFSVHSSEHFDIYFPVMSTLQFIFYIGWLKVNALLNPMGEDDDDFECNWLLDRNLRIGLTIADEGYRSTPEVMKDEFWNTDAQPLYSTASRPVHPLIGSTACIELPSGVKQVEMVPLGDGDEVFEDGQRSPPVSRKPSRAPTERRVSIVPSTRGASRNPSSDSNVMRNLRRRVSKFASKPSSASIAEMNVEKAAYHNGVCDTVAVDLATPTAIGGVGRFDYNDSFATAPDVSPFALSAPGWISQHDKRPSISSVASDEHPPHAHPSHHPKRQGSVDDIPIAFVAKPHVEQPHQVVSDTISETAETNDSDETNEPEQHKEKF